MSRMNLFNIILKSIESCEKLNNFTQNSTEDFSEDEEIFKNEYSGVYYEFINMLRENGYIKESEETTK